MLGYFQYLLLLVQRELFRMSCYYEVVVRKLIFLKLFFLGGLLFYRKGNNYDFSFPEGYPPKSRRIDFHFYFFCINILGKSNFDFFVFLREVEVVINDKDFCEEEGFFVLAYEVDGVVIFGRERGGGEGEGGVMVVDSGLNEGRVSDLGS